MHPEITLFEPCLARECAPEIGRATAIVLERVGVRPLPLEPGDVVCCGQPLYKQGRLAMARRVAARFIERVAPGRPVVVPGGSCVAMIRRYPELFPDDPATRARAEDLAARTYELSEYLVEVLGVEDLSASFPFRAAFHASCQVSRALGVVEPPLRLLARVRGLTLAPLARPERCCGFGGAMSLEFPTLTEAITAEKIADIVDAGAEAVICAEPSCLANMAGYLARAGSSIRAVHLALVLAGEGA